MAHNKGKSSGAVLTVGPEDIEEMAVRITEMWTTYNQERSKALSMGEEARRYVFATDIDQTSALALPHKNRTHIPKLTEISDSLQSEYYDASLSMPEFFRFRSTDTELDRAKKIELWVRVKLEQKKFRETIGRELIADYVIYGNCFTHTDYVREIQDSDLQGNAQLSYAGPKISRISPLDIVFNPRAESFRKSPKILRKLVHVGEIADWSNQFPTSGFKNDIIQKAILGRSDSYISEWADVIKERGLNMDGFGSFEDYFRQDMAEILIYFGDVFNPTTGKTARDRVLYIMDRVHVIRNEESSSPTGFDGIHHARWRTRADNLWGQGPLDNLVGMQYRIDHLENLRADVFDLIAHPVIKISGEDVVEPEEGYSPGAVYYIGAESDVEMMVPDTTALQADSQINIYSSMMDEFAGVPATTQGVRTPGEKSAFEVDTLNSNGSKRFVDKARNFELMLEGVLKEIFELMLINFDGSDFVEIFDDVTGSAELQQLSLTDVNSRGEFTAIGARHWVRRNRETTEINNFLAGPAQQPLIAQHISGLALAELLESKLQFDEADIVQPFAGVKESAAAQVIAQSESNRLAGGEEQQQDPASLVRGQGQLPGGNPSSSQSTDEKPQ